MTVLLADDDGNITTALRLLLNAEGLDSLSANEPAQVINLVNSHSFDLALVDLNYGEDTTSGREGMDLITAIRNIDSELPIIVMTGWGTVDIAVEAMRRGAMDFVEKPWNDNNRLIHLIKTQIKLAASRKKAINLTAENKLLKQAAGENKEIVCDSVVMQELLDIVHRVSKSDIPILITGENGTGKGLLASYIHQLSKRSDGPFISINMGGIADSTFESEMFGHVPGAFTDAKKGRVGRVELADGGTLFMDEIANMPLAQQAKILRLLEDHQFERLGSSQARMSSVRIISATNASLDKLVTDHFFREDLLFRLNGITLRCPPLRERLADIEPLANGFLEEALMRYETSVLRFSDDAMCQLKSYPWPGNVRELQFTVERSVLLCRGEIIEPIDFQLSSETPSAPPTQILDMELKQMEDWFVEQILKKCNGNATAAAEALGISRSALYRRIGKSI
jgi:DNA-binding NtrC family response regulator